MPRIGAMLVGREHERREIERVLAQARAGSSATLALVGQPGIGKTVLLADALNRASRMRVLRARGIESEAEVPFTTPTGSMARALRRFCLPSGG